MEIINANSASLCNYEVMLVLQEIKDSKENKKFKTEGSLATVTYETLRYLQETESKTQSKQQIDKFLDGLKSYKLTKSEKLILVNNLPRSPLDIQLMIQESEERLSEKEVEGVINLVNEMFPLEFCE